MPGFVLLLVLASASIHVVWNAWVKGSDDKVTLAWLVSTVSFVVMTPMFVGSRILAPGHLDGGVLALGALSGLFEALYMILLYNAYDHGDLSLVYPISRGTAPVVTALVGWRLVGDKVTTEINGRLVNKATGCEAGAGPICFTSEGNEIQFRNIRVKKLK